MEEQLREIKSKADAPVPPEVSLVVGNVAPVDAGVCKKTIVIPPPGLAGKECR